MVSPLLSVRATVRITDKIFWLAYDNAYDMCMTWLRVAEFRESSSHQAHRKPFKILDYMHWYAAVHGEGSFSYPADWAGFNIAKEGLHELYVELGAQIVDWNIYDTAALSTYLHLCNTAGPLWCLCCTMYNDYETLRHELAHALWATDPEYRELQEAVIKSAQPELIAELEGRLHRMGYGPEVYADEIQAHVAADRGQQDITDGLPRMPLKHLRLALRKNLDAPLKELLKRVPRL